MALDEFKSVGIQFVSYQQNIDTAGPFGEFFFTIVAAFGQLEHAMIRERVKAGLRNARAKGKRLGRPRVFVSEHRIQMLRGLGVSWRDIAEQLGVGVGTVHRTAQARSKNVCGGDAADGPTTETSMACA